VWVCVCVYVCERVKHNLRICIMHSCIYIFSDGRNGYDDDRVGGACVWIYICVWEDPAAKEMNSSDTSPFRMCTTAAAATQDYVRWRGDRRAPSHTIIIIYIYMHTPTSNRQPTTILYIRDDHRCILYTLRKDSRRGTTNDELWRAYICLKVIARVCDNNVIHYDISVGPKTARIIFWYFLGGGGGACVYVNNYISIISVEENVFYQCCSCLNCIYFNLFIVNDAQRV